MRTNANQAEPSATVGERLCYYCNEGSCALCTGWDRTVADGKIIEVPCAHGCRELRKPNQWVTTEKSQPERRRA